MVVINSPNMDMRTYVYKDGKWKQIHSLFAKTQTVDEICTEINKINSCENRM